MNFTKFDMMILITSLLAVIVMSLTFPMLGMAGEEADEDDVPSFDIDSDRFNFAGEFPENPGTPSQFYLFWNDQLGQDSDNVRWLDGDVDDGHEILITDQTGTQGDPQADVIINHWDAGTVVEDETFSLNFTEYETVTDFGDGYDLFVEFDRKENITWDGGQSEGVEVRVNVEVRDQPEDSGWLTRVPIIGGVLGTADAVASMVGWIGSILWWGVTWFFQIAATLLAILFDTIVFAFDVVAFITGTYGEILTADNVSSWAILIAHVPLVLFLLELAKLTMVAISLLPTT